MAASRKKSNPCSTGAPTGLLPSDLSGQVPRALGADAIFDVGAIVRATDLTPEQVATQAATMSYSSLWVGRMELHTRDRVHHMVEQDFAPPEPAPVDPLARARRSSRTSIRGSARPRSVSLLASSSSGEPALARPSRAWKVMGMRRWTTTRGGGASG